MNHFTSSIQRSGLPWEYNSNIYEHMHISHMKNAYRASNKRAATPQIVKHNRRLQALRKIEIEAHDKEIEKPTTLEKV